MSNKSNLSFSDDTIDTNNINTDSLFDGNSDIETDSIFGGDINLGTEDVPSDTFSVEFTDLHNFVDQNDEEPLEPQEGGQDPQQEQPQEQPQQEQPQQEQPQQEQPQQEQPQQEQPQQEQSQQEQPEQSQQEQPEQSQQEQQQEEQPQQAVCPNLLFGGRGEEEEPEELGGLTDTFSAVGGGLTDEIEDFSMTFTDIGDMVGGQEEEPDVKTEDVDNYIAELEKYDEQIALSKH